MKCLLCSKNLRENDSLLRIYQYVKNERRGDFVSNAPDLWVHLGCVRLERGSA